MLTKGFLCVQVTLAPADYESWSVARSETMAEAKAGLKAKLEAEMAAAADDGELKALRDRFSREERELEHKIGARLARVNLAAEPIVLTWLHCRAQTTRSTRSPPLWTCNTT